MANPSTTAKAENAQASTTTHTQHHCHITTHTGHINGKVTEVFTGQGAVKGGVCGRIDVGSLGECTVNIE